MVLIKLTVVDVDCCLLVFWGQEFGFKAQKLFRYFMALIIICNIQGKHSILFVYNYSIFLESIQF